MIRRLWVLAVLVLGLGCSHAPGGTAVSCMGPTADEGAAAAATAAGSVVSPTRWLALNGTASRPQSRDWTNAVIELAAVGDAFTLQQLQALDRSKLTPEQQTVLEDTLGSIAARTPDTAASVAASMQSWLERAGWADLRCDPLEQVLVPWVGHSIAAFSTDPAVRAELERVRDGYAPEGQDTATTARMSDRVRGWAKALLESPDPDLRATMR
jgi:hypothetical protein